jgi:site-specific DNA-methyltransferase (adenine-specific)
MTRTVQIGPCTLHCGDCRDGLGTIDRADCAITDPPYGETSLDWDSTVSGWAALLPTDSLWCFGSLRFFLKTATEFDGWKQAQEIVWEKHNCSNFHADRFKRVHELAVHWYRGQWAEIHKQPQFTNDATKRTIRRKKRPTHTGHIDEGHYVSEDGGPRMMRSVLKVRSCHGYAIHPTEKPVGIIEPLVLYSCPPGGVVVDPFFGSGSVAEACIVTGRRFIGWEIHPERFEAGCSRVARAYRDSRSQLPFSA